MNVMLVNGSPHKEGNTHIALTQIAETLREEGVSSEIFRIGGAPGEAAQDAKGMQTMRTLARNMAFLLKCKQVGLENGVPLLQRSDFTIHFFHLRPAQDRHRPHACQVDAQV